MITTLSGTTVLVTGISGFIGSHLARRLLAEGASVHGLAKPNSDMSRISDIKNSINVYRASLEDEEALKAIFKDLKPVKVYHLAAHVNQNRSLETFRNMTEINIKGTLNLLQALELTDCDCFINTGSSEEYGDNPVPFNEEQMPNPVSPYSTAKVATTMLCQMLHRTHGLPIVTLRPFSTYGPGQRNTMLIPMLISEMIKKETPMMTAGEQTRDFIYVDDVVDGFIRASICPSAIGQIINLGTGRENTVKDTAEMIVRLLESRIKPVYGTLDYRLGEPMRSCCDTSKAQAVLRWRAQITLEEGLRRTIAWFRRQNKI